MNRASWMVLSLWGAAGVTLGLTGAGCGGNDSGVDGAQGDAGGDAAASDEVACLSARCSLSKGEVCCATGVNQAACTQAGQCNAAAFACTSTANCQGGVCCRQATLTAGSTCTNATTCGAGAQLCAAATECPSGDACTAGLDGVRVCVAPTAGVSLGGAPTLGVGSSAAIDQLLGTLFGSGAGAGTTGGSNQNLDALLTALLGNGAGTGTGGSEAQNQALAAFLAALTRGGASAATPDAGVNLADLVRALLGGTQGAGGAGQDATARLAALLGDAGLRELVPRPVDAAP